MVLKDSDYNKGLVYTDAKGCIACNKCIKGCPTLKANVSVPDSDGRYKVCVDENECIQCGLCLDYCDHDVRRYRDDCDEFLSDLKQGKEFSILIAPAFYINYPERHKNVLGYLKSLGVKNFYSVSFGADIAVWGYINYLSERNAASSVAQPCPCIVSYIEKHQPELLQNIIPVQSPMMCTAIYLKKYLGIEEELVFLSPCIAKKVEIQSKRGLGLVSHNVTFKNLMDHVVRQGVNLDDFYGDEAGLSYGMGSLFPQPGGLSENIVYYLGPEAGAVQIDGEHRVYKYLETFAANANKRGGIVPTLVDALNCYRGCNFGSGLDTRNTGGDDVVMQIIAMRNKQYYAMIGADQKLLLDPAGRFMQLNEKFKDLNLEDFMCEYENNHKTRAITDFEIEAVFIEKLQKLTGQDQHVDCTACGYSSCRQMAEAIAYGINHSSNCVYYVKESLTKNMEEASAAEERLRNIIDIMPLAANFRDKNREVMECNDEVIKLYGLKDRQEYIDRFHELLPQFQPDGTLTREKAEAMHKQAITTGSAQFELSYQSLDGEPIPCEVTLLRLMWQGERHVASFIKDRREFYKSQENAQIIEQRLQAMLDASPMLCAIFDENYNVTEVNEEAVRLLKLGHRQEFIDKFYEMSPKKQLCGMLSREKAVAELRKALREGKNYIAEWMHKASDGELVPVEVFLERVKLEGKNVVVSYARDLRPLQAAISLALEANEMYKMFLNASPMMLEIWDNNYNLIDCNHLPLEHFGVSSIADYIENYSEYKPALQPCGTPSMEKLETLLKTAFAEGRARSEFMHLSSIGELMPFEAHFVRLVHHGENVVVSYSHDLRDIKNAIEKLQQEEQRRESIEAENQSKTRFLAQMSHEIRTPLNAVLGIAELQLMEENLSAENRDAFQRIHRSSNLLLGIINDILDLAKVAAGKMEIMLESYDSLSLIVDTVQLHSVYLGEKSIQFKLEIDEKLPTRMIGDELRIKQIMNNILSNAFKYTDRGTVTFSLGVEDLADGLVMLVIKISDTGVGMTKEQISGLFDEFTRYDLQRSRRTEGTGLGMSITYMLTKLMQGDVEVKSEPGEGTTFIARIPQRLDGTQVLGAVAFELQNFSSFQRHSRHSKRSSTFVREPMPYGRVLVVDDVESNLHVAKGFLQAYKLSVDTAESGYQVIDKIDAGETYDIIFMDHMMPGLDGIKTTEILRDRGYDRPIVALTANAIKGQDEFFEGLGFSGFISKPIVHKQLDECLIRLIRDKQPLEIIEAARREHGMLYSAGEKANQRLLVEAFLCDTQKAILVLELILSKEKLGADVLEKYTVHVHGMKTALHNIGKVGLAKDAHILEKAGEGADIATIKAMTPAFLNSLCDIAQELELWLEQESSDGEDGDTVFLRDQLLLISQACEAFDIDGAKNMLDTLGQRPCSEQTKALLKEMESCLLCGDFEEVIRIAGQYGERLREK